MGVTLRNPLDLRDIQRRLDEVNRGRMLPELTKRIGVALVKEVNDEFRQSRDPYGKPWKPVFRNRKRDRRAAAKRAKAGLPPRAAKPLVDTGRLRASVMYTVTGSLVRVSLPVEYASFHQYGTRTIARRQILPERDTGGHGPYFLAAISREVSAVVKKAFGEGG